MRLWYAMHLSMPVSYTHLDVYKRQIQHLPVERTERKSNGGIAALFARFSFKKKSRADIVKLVASGDLVPEMCIRDRLRTQEESYRQE